MIFKYDAAIIGGDLRQIFLANILSQRNYNIICFINDTDYLNDNIITAEAAYESIKSAKVIITPIPFTKDKIHLTGLDDSLEKNKLAINDFLNVLNKEQFLIGGNFPKNICEYCKNNNILFFDLLKNESISSLNSIATAEGAIATAIIKSQINIHQSKGLILGYGKCGKTLADKLKSLGMNVTIGARKKSVETEAYIKGFKFINLTNKKPDIHNYDFIFNTIPSVILVKDLLLSLKPDTTIIDIASAPGGIDYDFAQKLNLRAYHCLGIPGKVSPESSAQFIAEAILPILKERSD